ncbi:hypothetical protein ACHAW5_005739 [Stephanodiscus triporus]|uniref:PDZ domain-containing protein n=1 Tax=Stephanodiscus triporus TaxID=2934178 RepID=A0ABD3N530_9STRA
MDRRSSGAAMRTPSKSGRAFGTRLSANSPLPSQREQLQQQPSLSKSAKKKRLDSISEITTSGKKKEEKRPQSQPKTGNHAVAERNSATSALKLPPPSTTTTTSIEREDVDCTTAATTPASMLRPAAAATPLSAPGSGVVNRGKNLMHHFNYSSPSIGDDNDDNHIDDGQEVVFGRRMSILFSPRREGDGVGEEDGHVAKAIASSSSSPPWTKFTPKIQWQRKDGDDGKAASTPLSSYHQSTNADTWMNVASSAPTLGLAAFPLSSSSSSSSAHSTTAINSAGVVTTSLLYPPRERQHKTIASPMYSSTSSKKVLFTPSQSYSPPRWPTASLSPPTTATIPASSSSEAGSTTISASSAVDEASVIMSSATAAAAAKSSIQTALSIGPSEYAIRFPAGQTSLHLEFEPVTLTSGRMTGCGIAKVLPEFYKKLNSNAISYLPEPLPCGSSGSNASANDDRWGGVKVGEEEDGSSADAKTSQSMIQVNDLVVSINGISVLSRKYDIIMELLHHERFHHVDRIIVFRSIEKLWRSRSSSYSHQFTRRTMRHLRTGKRIATALNDDVLLTEDNSELLLRTWVETPTQVLVARNRQSRTTGGGVGFIISTDQNIDSITRPTRDFGNASSAAGNDKDGNTEDQGGGGQRLSRCNIQDESSNDDGGPDNKKLDSIGEMTTTARVSEHEAALISTSSSPKNSSSTATTTPPITTATNRTPSSTAPGSSSVTKEGVDDMMTMTGGSSFLFSPSNVKKILRRSGDCGNSSRNDYLSPIVTKVSTTPASSSSSNALSSSQSQSLGVELFSASAAASTAKKSNVRRSSSKQQQQTIAVRLSDHKYDNGYNTSSSRSSHMVERICKVLMGNEILGDMGGDFEQSLRLKKAVVEEIKYAHFLLLIGETKQRAVDATKDLQSNELSSKGITNQSRLQEVAAVAQKVESASAIAGSMMISPTSSRSEANVSENSERYDTQKVMIDMQSQLDDSNAIESKENHAAIVTALEQRIAVIEADRDDAHLELEKARLAVAKAKDDADMTLKAMDEERLSFHRHEATLLKQVSSLEELVEATEQKFADSTKSLNTVESERDVALIELEREQLALSVVAAELAICKASSIQRDSSHTEHVCALEERLAAKENAESVREKAHQELEQRLLALSGAESVRDELNNELDNAQLKIAQLEMEKNEAVSKALSLEDSLVKLRHEIGITNSKNCQLITEIEELTAKHKATESERREYMDKLQHVTCEKEEAEAQLRESNDHLARLEEEVFIANSKNSQLITEIEECTAKFIAIESEKREYMDKLEHVACVKTATEAQFRESTDHLAMLKEQVLMLSEEKNALEMKVAMAAADLDKATKAAEQERLHLQQCNALCEEQVHSLEKRLKIELEKLNAAEMEASQSRALCFNVQRDFKELEHEREFLQMNIANLKAASASTEAERTELIARVHRLEHEISDGKVSESENQSELQSLSSALKAAHDELSVLKCDRLHLENLVTDLKSNMTLSNAKSEEDLKFFQASTCTLNYDISVLKSKLVTAEKGIDNEQAVVKVLEAELSTKQRALDCLLQESSAEKESLTADLDIKTAEIVALQSSQKALTEQMNDLAIKLEGTKSDAMNQNANLMAESKQLSMQLIESDNDAQRYKAICNDLKYKLETAEALLDEGDAEIQSLTYVGETLKTKVINLEALLENAEDALSHLKDEYESLAIDKESMQTQFESEIDVLREKERELTDQMKRIEELHFSSRNELQMKLADAQNVATQSKTVNAGLRSKLESAEKTLVEANANIQSLLKDCSCWKRQVNDLEILLANADEANTKQKDEVESLTVELKGLRHEKDSMAVEMMSKEAEIIMLNERMSELSNQLNTVCHVKDEYESLAIDKESMQTQFESEIDVLREKERELTDQMKRIEELHFSSRNELQMKLADAQNVATQSKTVNAGLRSKLESAEKSLVEANANIQSLLKDCSCWKRQVNDLEILLANADEANTKQKDEVESLTVELKDLRHEKDSMAVEMMSKEAEIVMLNERMSELSNQLNTVCHLKDEYESLAIDKESMQTQFESEIDVLREKERELTDQMKRIEELHFSSRNELQMKLADAQNVATQSKTVNAGLRSKLESAEKSLVEANANIQSLLKDCSCWKRQVNDLEILLANADEANTKQKDEVESLTVELKDLRHEKDSMAVEMMSKEAEIVMLNERMSELSNQLNTVCHVKDEYESLAIDKESMQTQFESEIDVLREKERELTDQMKRIEELHFSSRNELQMKLADAQNVATQSKTVNAGLRSKLESAEKSLVEANANIQSLLKDCSCWKRQVNDLEILLANADEANTKQKDEVESLTVELKDLRHEKDSMAVEMMSKEAEIVMLNERMNELSNQLNTVCHLKDEYESLAIDKESMQTQFESEIDVLREKERELTDQMKRIEELHFSSRNELQMKLADAQNVATQSKTVNAGLRSKLESAEKSLVEANANIQSLLKDCSCWKRQVNDLEILLANADEANTKQKDEVESLTVELKDLRHEKDSMAVEMMSKEAEIVMLNERMSELSNQLNTVCHVKDEYESLAIDKESMQTQFESEIDVLREKERELTDQMKRIEELHFSSRNELQMKLADAQNVATQSKTVNAGLRSKLESAEKSLVEANANIQSLLKDCSCWKRQVNDLEILLANADEANTKQKDEVESLTVELKDLRHEKDSMAVEMMSKEAEIVMLNERMNELSNQLNTVCHLKDEYESLAIDKESMQTQFESEIDVLREKERELTDQMKRIEELHFSSRNELQMKLADAQNVATQSKTVNAGLRSKLESAEKSLVEANANIQSLLKDCSCWKRQVNDLEILLANADEANTKQKDEVESLTVELKDLRHEKDSMAVEMMSKEAEIVMLNERMNELSNQLNTVCHLKEEYESLAIDKESMQTQFESEIDVLREKERELTDQMKRIEELHFSSRNELQMKLADAQNVATQSKTVNAGLRSKLESAEKSLVEANANIQSLLKDCSCWKRQVNDLEILLANADEANTKQKDEVESLTVELKDLRHEKDSMAVEMMSKEAEIVMLNERMSELSNQLNTVCHVKDEYESLAIDKESMQTQFESEIDVLREKERELTDQMKRIEELHFSSRNELQMKLADAQNVATQSKTVNAGLRSKLESAEKSLVEANANIQSLLKDCSCWKRQVNDLEILLANADEANTKQKDEVESLTVELKDLRHEKDSMAVEMMSKEAEIVMLNERMSELSNQLNTVCHVKDEYDDGHKLGRTSELSALEMDLARLNTSIKMKEVENASLLSQLREWKTTFDDLAAGLSQAEAQYQSQLENNELRQNELLSRNSDLTATVENLSSHVQHIEAKSRRDKLSHEVALNQFSIDIRDLQNALSGTKIKCIHLANELEAKTSYYLRAVTEKECELETTTSVIASMEQEICRLTTEVSSASETISLLKSEGNATKCALITELNETKESFEVERKSLYDRIQCLQRELNESLDAMQQQSERIAKNEALHASDLELWREKSSQANGLLNERQVEIDRLTDELYSATRDHEKSMSNSAEAHESIIERMRSAHDRKINELHRRTLEFSGKLQECKVEMNQLQHKLQGEVDKNISLREYDEEKERKLQEQSAEIELLNMQINLIGQSMSKAEHEFTWEKQRLNDEINTKKAAIELQNLAMTKVVEESNQSEMRLRTKLEATRSALIQLSIDLADTREGVIKAIEDSKNATKEGVERVVNTFKADIDASQCQVESVISKLSQAKKQFHEELLMKDEEIKALASAQLLTVSENEEMKLTIQQQEELLSQLNRTHKNQVIQLQESIEIATMNWANEKASHESKIQSLQDVVKEKCILNRSLVARLEVAAILAQRDDKFDKMFDAVGIMKNACDEYCVVDSSQDSKLEEMQIMLESREKLIKFLSVDLTLAQDEIVSLKAEVECAKEIGQCETMSLREEYTKKLSALVENIMNERASIESDWRSFQTALHQLAVCIAHEDQELPIEALPEMTALLKTFFKLFQQKVDQISSLQSELKNLNMNRNYLNEEIDPFRESRDDLAVYDLMSEIKVANQRMEEMSRKLDSEASHRTMSEMICKTVSTALIDANERIATMENQIREMEEHALLQSNEIKELETYVDVTRNQISAIGVNAQSKSKQAKDMEMHLEQVEIQKRKLELLHERSIAEVESSQKHSIDLTAMIIEKNKEVASNESTILELQYKVDHLEATIEGWIFAFEGLTTNAELGISSPDDVAGILAASTLRQDTQLAEIAKLKEQCLQMKEELSQQASMHAAIVNGLESECLMLSKESDNVHNELKEKQEYIIMLEDAKLRLEAKGKTLKKDKEEIHRRLSDLQKSSNILRQQKLASELLSNEVISAVKQLAGIAIVHSAELTGVPTTSLSRATWSENIDFVAHLIEHLSKMNQKCLLDIEHMKESIWRHQTVPISGQVAAEASTSKAEGRIALAELMDLASQHSDILEGLKSMKNSIASVMSSPKLLTPVKFGRQEECDAQRITNCDEDLYSDLLRAHEQLESLSAKIEAFQDDQIKWKEWETYFKSRISELEQENQIMKAAPLDLSKSKMQEMGAVLIYNIQHRYNQMISRRAFQTWSSQARMLKHVYIAKQVAKELAKTRKTVLLLKTHFIDDSNP